MSNPRRCPNHPTAPLRPLGEGWARCTPEPDPKLGDRGRRSCKHTVRGGRR